MKILMLICLLISNIFNVSVSDVSPSDIAVPELGHGLSIETQYYACDPAKVEEISYYVTLTSESDAPAENAFIIGFDVSESGKLAIVTDERRLVVYDAENNYSYSATFDYSGEYGVLWAGENVALMSKSMSSAYIFDDNCKLIGVYRITSKARNYWNNIVMAQQRNVGGTTYTLNEKRTGCGSCSNFIFENGKAYKKLYAANADGEKLLYQSSENYVGDAGELNTSSINFLAIVGPIAAIYVISLLVRKFAPSANPKA
ncbi:MAG: hypothetical protein E7559_07905 [Ruminococcaceae bacterium]|nr:hypothetical protein [Oscillospiraceae bacterium]